MTEQGPLVLAENLSRHYEVNSGLFKADVVVKALSGASFELQAGKTLAVVGESGCGKSTLARLVTMIEPATAGNLFIDGEEITATSAHSGARSGAHSGVQSAALRSKVQIVFQDPFGSLNPRQKVGRILEEPLVINRKELDSTEREDRARRMLELVGLRPEHYARYPHMFSGGQRQRIAVARALMLDPQILVLDEPVSALDLSIQSQILNLLVDLQDKLGLAYLFISHDLSVVKHMADDVMVMYLGKPVEMGTREAIFNNAQHPYTRALLSATPVADPARQKERIRLSGELPSPINPPAGCAFHPRCWKVQDDCRLHEPELGSAEHKYSCHHPIG